MARKCQRLKRQLTIQGVHPSNASVELTLYEVHTDLDLKGFEDMGNDGAPSGLKLPYIVTIVEDTGEVLQFVEITKKWTQ